MTAAAALTDLASKGISAVPVQTLKELVERHRTEIERLEDAGIVGPIEWYRRMYQST